MGYIFNASTKRITLTSGTTSFTTNDLYSRWKNWVLEGNAGVLQPFATNDRVTAIGGESLGGSLTSGFYLFITNGWSIIPWNSNHTLTVSGNLLRDPDDNSGVAVFQQVAANVLIRQDVSAVALGYSTSGGSGGDATLANQTAIISTLGDMKGTTFDASTDSLEKIRDAITVAINKANAAKNIAAANL
jgi:hypothetical protein